MIDRVLLLNASTTIRDAIDHLVRGGRKAVFIVEDDMRLLGLFTNGDMRSILLRNTDFSRPITDVMNRSPILFSCDAEAIEFARGQRKLVVYPIVRSGYLEDVIFDDDERLAQQSSGTLNGVPLVIIAGGKGTRLLPYTKVIPKALFPIGEMTVTERIIHSFYRYGCRDVYMILNHKGGMIRAYFNDIKSDYRMHYAQEWRFLGTAGGLSLLKGELKGTFVVSNCDILIEDDLSCAYVTHKKDGNAATVVCSAKTFTVPYGVIHAGVDGKVARIEEKPQLQYLVNTGVYVMEPEVLRLLREDEVIDMPDLLERLIANGMRVGVFPVSEQAWMDMGQFDAMNHMLEHYDESKQRRGDE